MAAFCFMEAIHSIYSERYIQSVDLIHRQCSREVNSFEGQVMSKD